MLYSYTKKYLENAGYYTYTLTTFCRLFSILVILYNFILISVKVGTYIIYLTRNNIVCIYIQHKADVYKDWRGTITV